MQERFDDHAGGLWLAKETGSANRFKPNAWICVACLTFQKRQRIAYLIPPITKHARGSRAGPRVGRLEHSPKQMFVDRVVMLVDPQRFEHMMFDLFVLRIQPGDPFV